MTSKQEPEHPLTQSEFEDFWQSCVTDLIWRGKNQAASDLASAIREFHAACCRTAPGPIDSWVYRWHHERCARWGGVWLAMLNVASREEWHRKQRAERRAQRKARS